MNSRNKEKNRFSRAPEALPFPVRTVKLLDVAREASVDALINDTNLNSAYVKVEQDEYLDTAPILEFAGPESEKPSSRRIFIPGRHLCMVRKCFLFGPFGFVVYPDGRVVLESTDDGRPHQFFWSRKFLNQNYQNFQEKFQNSEFSWPYCQDTIYSSSFFAHANYLHWLSDCLSYLDVLEQNIGADRAKAVIFPLGLTGFQKESLKLIQDTISLQSYNGDRMFSEKILFTSRTGQSRLNQKKARYLRYKFPPNIRSLDTNRLIYIERKNKSVRGIVNENQVKAMLDEFGFEFLSPETLSFQEQVNIFAEARLTMGVHGAGLANALFMKPRSVLLELRPVDASALDSYAQLSSAADLYYNLILGETVGPTNVNPRDRQFYVDVGQARRVIRSILQSQL